MANHEIVVTTAMMYAELQAFKEETRRKFEEEARERTNLKLGVRVGIVTTLLVLLKLFAPGITIPTLGGV